MPKRAIRSRNLKAWQHNNRRLQAFLVLFLLVIVLCGLQITASDYPFGVFKLFLSFFIWLLCCLAFTLRLLITPFGIFKLFLSFFIWLLCCLAFKLRLLITPLASSNFFYPFSFGYCVVWPSNYGFWLPLWRLQAFLVLFRLVIVVSWLHITASDYPFGEEKGQEKLEDAKRGYQKRHLKARQHNNQKKKDKKSLKTPNG
jgi:uncharacterized membrane protein